MAIKAPIYNSGFDFFYGGCGNSLSMLVGFVILSFIVIFNLTINICKTKKKNKDKSLINFLKTRSKKLIFLSLFLFWQYFNFTGFCYQEMRYLSGKELLDKTIAKQFVMEDKDKREKSLNRKCSIRKISEFELNEEFTEKKCGDITYSSWKEFFEKGLKNKCEDFDKKFAIDCGTFYYSSLEEFYKDNPNCCEVNNSPIWDGSSPFSQGMIESPGDSTFEKLFGMTSTYVQLDQMPNPDSPRITIDHCGNIKRKISRKVHQNFLKKSLTSN